MNEIVIAFRKWQETTECSCEKHWLIGEDGVPYNTPYSLLCPREQAWRDYCAIRDNYDNWKKEDLI